MAAEEHAQQAAAMGIDITADGGGEEDDGVEVDLTVRSGPARGRVQSDAASASDADGGRGGGEGKPRKRVVVAKDGSVLKL